MARLFGDSFDMYATTADMILGRWSSFTVGSSVLISGANTAFTIGQGLRQQNATLLVAVFDTATNETTIYFSLRFKNTTSTTSAQILSLQLRDGTNVQCTIAFCGDNAIRVYSGTTAGTLLSTLASAFSAATWDSYQGKIVINNTTGSVEIRKNGSTTPTINLSSVNTRAGSANAYANQLAFVFAGTTQMDIDDVWLNSDNGAAPTTWPGDVRCVTQMVASDSSVAFTKSPNPSSVTPFTANSTVSKATGLGIMGAFTASFTGTISSATVQVTTGGTGNLKAAIYDSTRTTVLATSNATVNPVAGPNAITFGTPLSVTKGTAYYLAVDADFTIVYTDVTTGGFTFTTAYASFPAASPTTAAGVCPVFTMSIVPTLSNEFVFDPTQDGDTSYVYSSTVAQEDKYGIAALTVTPASIIGVTPFVMWKKSDSGARTGTVSVTANGSADTAVAAITGITPSLSYGYKQGFMPLDPTSAAWTTANVNSMLLGLTVAS